MVQAMACNADVVPFGVLKEPRAELIEVCGVEFDDELKKVLSAPWVIQRQEASLKVGAARCKEGLMPISSHFHKHFSKVPEFVLGDESVAALGTFDAWTNCGLPEEVWADGFACARTNGNALVVWQVCGLHSVAALTQSLAIAATYVCRNQPSLKADKALSDEAVPVLQALRKDIHLSEPHIKYTFEESEDTSPWETPVPFGTLALLTELRRQAKVMIESFRRWIGAHIDKAVLNISQSCPAFLRPCKDSVMSDATREEALYETVAGKAIVIQGSVNILAALVTNVKKTQKDGMGPLVDPGKLKAAFDAKNAGVETLCVSWALSEYRTKVQTCVAHEDRIDYIEAIKTTMGKKQVVMGKDLQQALELASKQDFAALTAPCVKVPQKGEAATTTPQKINIVSKSGSAAPPVPANPKRRRTHVADLRAR